MWLSESVSKVLFSKSHVKPVALKPDEFTISTKPAIEINVSIFWALRLVKPAKVGALPFQKTFKSVRLVPEMSSSLSCLRLAIALIAVIFVLDKFSFVKFVKSAIAPNWSLFEIVLNVLFETSSSFKFFKPAKPPRSVIPVSDKFNEVKPVKLTNTPVDIVYLLVFLPLRFKVVIAA